MESTEHASAPPALMASGAHCCHDERTKESAALVSIVVDEVGDGVGDGVLLSDGERLVDAQMDGETEAVFVTEGVCVRVRVTDGVCEREGVCERVGERVGVVVGVYVSPSGSGGRSDGHARAGVADAAAVAPPPPPSSIVHARPNCPATASSASTTTKTVLGRGAARTSALARHAWTVAAVEPGAQ